jgi:phage-related minor tail protein
MTTIATLAVRLIADAENYKRTLEQTERQAQSWSTNVSQSLKTAGGAMTSTGQMMTLGLTVPIIAAGVAALNYASDLEETKNKVSVVFGSMSDDVMSWSKTSDTAMGISQQKALDAVATFGAMGQSAGLSANDNLTWSQSLVQLSSDWSSFYNLDPVDSLNAIQSAVAGQYEPLRRMGIVINQASLEQKALQLGLMEEGGTLSDAARYQALYALMVEKSSAAQGDFARTADGVANQTRIAKAQFENAAATLGTQLLPYAAQLLGWISQAITWFQALTPEQQKWIVGIAAAVAIIGPLLIVIGSLVTAIGAIVGVVGAITTPILIVIAVIAALIAIGYLLYQAWINNWGGIQEKTATAIAFIQGIINGGIQFIHDLTSGKLGVMSAIWLNTFNFIKTYIQNFINFWKAIFAAFTAAANGDWYTFGAKMREAVDLILKNIADLVKTSWTNIKLAFSALITNIITFFKNANWADIGRNIMQGIANGISAGASLIISAAKNAASAALEAAKGFLGIHSPSTVFQDQVGWQMAAGAAMGWEEGLDAMLAPTMPGLLPNGAGSTAGTSTIGSVAASKGGNQIYLTVNLNTMGLWDEQDVARRIGPAVLTVMRENGVY